MIDVKKILELTSDERNVLKELIKLYDEAEEVVKLISLTWKFEMKANEIDLTSTVRMLGFKNRLTHDGRWIVTVENEDREVSIDKETIYRLFEAEYLIKKELLSKDYEFYGKFRDMAKLSEYFRRFLDTTVERAEEENISI